MKMYAKITNESGKTAGKGSDEYLDIDISVGNERLAALTVRPTDDYPAGYALYDADDEVVAFLAKGKKQNDK